jgi:hypothetical protein
MEILHIAVLVDLGNFKVVNLLNHLLELGHDLDFFCFLADARLREDGLDGFRNNLGLELELARLGLPLEDDADEQLHAESDDGLLLS